MPRMPRYMKNEMAFFINEHNRISYFDRCKKCRHDCKQSFRVLELRCEMFERRI